MLTFRHTLYEPPRRYGEELVHGPFRRFEHVHEYEPCEAGTRVVDRLTIELPAIYGSGLCERLLIRPELERFFRFRHAALVQLASAGGL